MFFIVICSMVYGVFFAPLITVGYFMGKEDIFWHMIISCSIGISGWSLFFIEMLRRKLGKKPWIVSDEPKGYHNTW